MMAQTYDPSTREVETDRSLELMNLAKSLSSRFNELSGQGTAWHGDAPLTSALREDMWISGVHSLSGIHIS